MKKLLILLFCAVIALGSLAGCGDPAEVDNPDDPGNGDNNGGDEVEEPSGTLVVGIREASGNFNPAYYSATYDAYVVDLVFQGLITRNWEGEFEGVVAKDWEFSNEGKTITFNMRDDIVFSDGEPLTAHDVVFTYQLIADPSYTGRYGASVKDLVGYEEFSGEETQEFEGVVALNDHTVQFNFKEDLRVNLANCGFAIMPKHYYGKDYTYNNTAPIEAITSEAMGSGPYIMQEFKETELAYLVRNDKFNGEGYMVNEIILKFVSDTTEMVELTTGGVDLLAGQIEPKKIAQAREADMQMNIYPRSGYGYIKTNHEYGPTTDKEVRQALYYAFNVVEFVNNYYYDEETDTVLAGVQYHPFSQVSWAMDDDLLAEMTEYEFDLDKARQILDDAGWKLNSDGIREKDGEIMELKIVAMPDHGILNTLIPMWQRDWGEGLGIELNIAYLEFNTVLDYVIYNSDANVEEWSLFFLATTIRTPDPHSLYTSFHSKHIGSGESNTSRYRNARVDQLFDEGKAIKDIEEAKPYYREIAKILNEEAVMMPVYVNTYHDIYNPKLVDFRTSSIYNWVKAMKDARIED